MMRPADAARLVLLGAIWGSSFLFIEYALEDLTPAQIVAGRITVGAVVLVAVLYGRKMRLPEGRAWRALVFMAIASNVIPFALITWGQERISSSLAAILNSTTPLFTALLAGLFLAGERIGALRATGILVGFLGAAVIVGVDAEKTSLAGELAVVAASCSYAAGFVFARRVLSGRHGSPLRLSVGQLLLGVALTMPVAAFDTVDHAPDWGLGSATALLALGALGTGFAYVIYYRLIADVGATTASFVTYLIPLFGAALGTIFLDEELGWNALVGALLVIVGIAIAERGARRRPVRMTPAPVEEAASTSRR